MTPLHRHERVVWTSWNAVAGSVIAAFGRQTIVLKARAWDSGMTTARQRMDLLNQVGPPLTRATLTRLLDAALMRARAEVGMECVATGLYALTMESE